MDDLLCISVTGEYCNANRCTMHKIELIGPCTYRYFSHTHQIDGSYNIISHYASHVSSVMTNIADKPLFVCCRHHMFIFTCLTHRVHDLCQLFPVT